MGTIENIHNKINQKIDTGLEICHISYNLLSSAKKPQKKTLFAIEKTKSIKQQLADLDIEYNSYISAILMNTNDPAFYEKYIYTINKLRIIARLNSLAIEIRNTLDLFTAISNKHHLFAMANKMKNIYIPIGAMKKIQFDLCDVCKIKMDPNEDNSRIICDNCGLYKIIEGTGSTDLDKIVKEGKKIKNDNRDSTRHCKTWLDRIQAKKKKYISEEQLDKIRMCANKDYSRVDLLGKVTKRSIKMVTCNEIRNWLKESNMTELNDYIPLIRKLLGGETPYQLSSEEENIILTKFTKAMEIFDNELKYEINRSSRLYYPYCLFKIIEMIYPRNSPQRSLLECIHIQNDETVIDNDKIWEKTCNRIGESNGFVFIKTDRNLIEKERNWDY